MWETYNILVGPVCIRLKVTRTLCLCKCVFSFSYCSFMNVLRFLLSVQMQSRCVDWTSTVNIFFLAREITKDLGSGEIRVLSCQSFFSGFFSCSPFHLSAISLMK